MDMKLFYMPLAILALAACDEGRIEPDNSSTSDRGAEVRLEAGVTGADTWPEGYSLSLAGFADGNEYAVISKNIALAQPGSTSETILTGIPAEVSTIEVCVIDRLRRRVATFHSIPFNPEQSSERIRLNHIDMDIETAIHDEIFATTCANCHGGSGHAAAGLHLAGENTFAGMINVESVKEPGSLRVKPGDAQGSILYEILTTDKSVSWNYNHAHEIYDPVKLDLIKNWINHLKPE